MEPAPNQTLYLQNLNEKVQLAILKRSLYARFSEFGSIEDIVAVKNLRGRGQAFIVFHDITNAIKAKDALNNTVFLDKPMKIHFAKSISDAVQKANGTYDPKVREERAKRREANKKLPPAAEPTRKRTSEALTESVAPKTKVVAKEREVTVVGPNKVLFVKNLPSQFSETHLKEHFSSFEGLVSATLVPGRTGFAFVEFVDESAAAVCLQNTNNSVVNGNRIEVTFAKK
ncbi:hypothetical protein RCL1_002892 [Eukaryota sp. TZLM3-RCL]